MIGVVLSGFLDDGTAGAQAIKQCGGTVVVQDPRDAEVPSMPASACQYVEVDYCVASTSLVDTLVELVDTTAPAPVQVPPQITSERRVSEGAADAMEDLDRIGKPSAFACPDCDGVLWEITDSHPPRFRCHTGHAFSLRTLAHAQGTTTNKALWSAIRALQEREALLTAMAAQERQLGKDNAAARPEADAQRAAEEAERLRELAVAA